MARSRRAMAAVRRPGYDEAARFLACGRLLDDAAKLVKLNLLTGGREGTINAPRILTH